MRRLARLRPSPAMAVALVALFVALGGSVYAAGKLNGATIRKGSVPGNRIKPDSLGAKQVREASLGAVPAALHADQADQAANAEALDGFGSGAFSRVARSGHGDDSLGTGNTSGTAETVGILAPRDGFLLAIASAALHNDTTPDVARCILNFDDTDLASSRRRVELPGAPLVTGFLGDETCATNGVVPVTEGGHLVRFNFSDLATDTTVDEAELDVVFIPLAG